MTTATQTLKTAIGGYGHHAALKDGSITPDGVSLEQIEVAPIINDHWARATFPFEIVPSLRELGTAGLPYAGPSCWRWSSACSSCCSGSPSRDRRASSPPAPPTP